MQVKFWPDIWHTTCFNKDRANKPQMTENTLSSPPKLFVLSRSFLSAAFFLPARRDGRAGGVQNFTERLARNERGSL